MASESNQQLLLNADFGDDESEDDEISSLVKTMRTMRMTTTETNEEVRGADLGGEQHAEDEDDHEQLRSKVEDDAKE